MAHFFADHNRLDFGSDLVDKKSQLFILKITGRLVNGRSFLLNGLHIKKHVN